MNSTQRKALIRFGMSRLTLSLDQILPIRQVKAKEKRVSRYDEIVSSIPQVGLIEPLMVFPQKGTKNKYLLMDGHLRLEACRELGVAKVECLISLDDESYTYNSKINRLAPIQEHAMIAKAVANGVSVEKIALALHRNVKDISARLNLTDGICNEAIELLKDRLATSGAIRKLRRVAPDRQVEIAELMIAANNFTLPYVEALLISTPKSKLVEGKPKTKKIKPEDLAKMEREMEGLEREYRVCEQSISSNMLLLTVFRRYVMRLLANAKVERFLKTHHPEVLAELQDIAEHNTV